MSPVRASSKPSAGPVRVALAAGAQTLHRAGRVVQHLTVGLVDEPFGVTLITAQNADVSSLPCPPVEVLRYPVPQPWRFRTRVVEPLAEQLAEQNVEVLHALDSSAHALVRALSDELDLPYLLTVWGPGGARQVAPPGPLCRGVLAVSAQMRSALLAGLAVPEEMVRVIRPGVHQSAPRCQTGPVDRNRAIIAAGRFEPAGPFETVLRAFGLLRQAGYDCVLFLLGDGPAEHRLRQMAGASGLMHYVTFVDRLPQPQLPEIFSAADLFVYPHSDGRLELELLEAMAAGVPALVGECRVGDFALEGQTSLAYQARNPADLAAKLRGLLDDPAAASALADGARRHLREHHSPARMVAAMAELYRAYALSERTIKLA